MPLENRIRDPDSEAYFNSGRRVRFKSLGCWAVDALLHTHLSIPGTGTHASSVSRSRGKLPLAAVPNYHKPSGWKHHKHIISQQERSQVQTQSHQPKFKVLAGLAPCGGIRTSSKEDPKKPGILNECRDRGVLVSEFCCSKSPPSSGFGTLSGDFHGGPVVKNLLLQGTRVQPLVPEDPKPWSN